MTEIAFWKHFPVVDQTIEGLLEATIDFDRKYNFNLIKITPAGSWLAVCYGLIDAWENDHLGRRAIRNRCITNEDDWLNLKDINSEVNLIDTYVSVARELKSRYPHKPIYTTIFCPVSQAIQMAGLETFKAHILSFPEKVVFGLETITNNTIKIMKRFAALEIAGNYFVTQAMQKSMLTKIQYQEWGLPYDTVCLKASTLMFSDTIFHIHGEDIFFEVDPSLKEVVLHFEFDERLAAVYKQIRNKILPGIAQDDLARISSVEEANSKINLIQQLTGQELPMLTCGCVLPLDFADEQIHFWNDLIKRNDKALN